MGVQWAGPLAGVARGSASLPKTILHLMSIKYVISIPFWSNIA